MSRPLLARRHSYDVRRSPGEVVVFRSAPELGGLELRTSLYARIPFMAVAGMETRTKEVVRQLSRSSTQELEEARTDGYLWRVSVGEDGNDALRHDYVTRRLLATALTASASMFQFGYNTSVLNAPAASVFPGHSGWAVAVAAFALGGPVGAMIGGATSNAFGRKKGLLINAILFFLGGLIQTLAPSMACLTVGRVVTGAASGFASTLVPLYLGEVAPPILRGTFGAVAQLALVAGILAAALVAFSQRCGASWRVLVGVSPFLALVQLVACVAVDESPRWLVDKGENDAARDALRRLRNFQDDRAADDELGHILKTAEVHKPTTKGSSTFFDGPITAVVALHLAQQFCGINAVFYYSSTFLDGIVDDPLLGTTIVAAVNVAATWVAIVLAADYDLGRKPLLATSAAGMLGACVLVTLALLDLLPKIIALVALVLYVAFFELGLGPIPWSVVADFFESKNVDAAQSLSCQVNWTSNFVVGLVFPTINATLGPLAFLPFAIVLAATLAFVLAKFPQETKALAHKTYDSTEKFVAQPARFLLDSPPVLLAAHHQP
ncbi:hypothetical protein CTAYLR_000139 [Chrysophaeum taylorii]|uniref:Hexose transporter 1 n=1 Tax=Chrysophaeum taylorii TaxID=2483200 RepID=A0AAD7UIX8_9STRA|nr:hypothetical protein CTAYLR_000139 [Chrysophaeum taylorii]